MWIELAGVLPVPDCCHCCASGSIRHVKTKSQTALWPFAWVCDDCGAFVSCHPNSKNPVGYMAGRETRELRKAAHTVFDVLWRERLMSREKAYNWLSAKLGIDRERTHISWLTDSQLRLVITISAEYYNENAERLRKRKEKKDAKRGKRHGRENEHEKRKIIARKRNRRS